MKDSVVATNFENIWVLVVKGVVFIVLKVQNFKIIKKKEEITSKIYLKLEISGFEVVFQKTFTINV